MSKTYPKQLITLLLLLCGAAANAHDFEHNGIFYNILSATDNTVEVTFKGDAYDSSKGEYEGVVTIPSQVTHGDATYRVTGIGDCAFRQCEAVSSVIIPASVTSIGASAFSNCSGLTSIVSLIPADKLFVPNNDAFSNVPTSYCALYVPTGAKDTYANTGQWKEFAGITELGQCGDSLYWSLDKASQILYIYGDGAMQDYQHNPSTHNSPWRGDRSSISTIRFYGNITRIGSFSFENCNGLDSVVLPASVTSIGAHAFFACLNLTSVILPDGLTAIADGTFYRCESLRDIEIPESVTSIGDTAFGGCSFTSLKIPEGVTSIGESAFYGCHSLTSIIIPEGITSISRYTFSGCDSLTNIKLPDGITSIGDYAFDRCSALTSINIPAAVTGIGNFAFVDCSSLTDINIPAAVTSIGYSAFQGCTGLTSFVVEEGNTVYDSRGNCNALIETATNKLIAGTNNTIIPEGITSIGDYAFYGCAGLTSITIPASVTSIGNRAFTGCSSLASIEIPAGVTSIDKRAFFICSGLTSFVVEEGNTVYDSRGNCNALIETATNKLIAGTNNTIIPESITSIGDNAFFGCTGLTDIKIPAGVTSVGDYAFSCCTGLTDIKIPAGVTSIGDYTFSDCTGLTDVFISDGITGIGTYAFYGCSSLTTVEIPASVTSIGSAAFSYCSSLMSIISLIPADKVFAPGSSVFNKVNEFHCTLFVVAGAKSAYESTNQWKKFLNIVEISGHCGDNLHWSFDETAGTLTILGNGAMPDYSSSVTAPWYDIREHIKSVKILGDITSLGANAFSGCGNIEYITSFVPANKLFVPGSDAFAGIDKDVCALYVPAGSKTTYKATDFWKEFAHMTEFDGLCGNNLNWSFDEASATLSIIGNGAMYDYSLSSSKAAPWYDIRESIKAVKFLGSPTTIGMFAFMDCSALESIEIPASVTSIGNSALSGCSSLASIEIPAGVTSIGNSALSGCSSLASIEIPAGVTSINKYVFDGCTALSSVNIHEGVTSIGESAFSDCIALTSIKIPASVTSIANNGYYSAFYRCCALTSIVVDEGNPVYDSRNNCNALIETATNTLFTGSNNTIIPDGITSIGAYAFLECSDLASLYIPASVTNISNNAFLDCSGLTSIVADEENTVYDSRDNCNALIETATNSLVLGCKNTIIPTSVTSIGNSAFSDCTGLTSIDIPESVTSIGNRAFKNCTGLTSVCIPESVTIISSYVFQGCSGLTSIRFPESMTSIGSNAFQYCSALTSINIPANVTSIGYAAFGDCSSLTSIISLIPADKLFVPNEYAFAGIDKEKCTLYVVSGAAVAYARTKVWNEFPNITELGQCGDSLYWAFNETTGTLNIYGEGAMYDYQPYAPWYDIRESIKEVKFLGEATSIGSYAFSLCKGLTSIEIPASVTSIGNSAFFSCENLTDLEIPEGVTSIGEEAFSGCCNLTSVTSHIPAEMLFVPGENAFRYVDYGACTLYVPAGAKETYAATEQWKDFTNIQEPNTDNIVNVLPSGAAAVYYDLNGRRVKRPTRGIYIVNGKKVFIK